MSNELVTTLETAITQQSEIKFHNKKLAQHTKAIEKLLTQTKRNMFEISARLLVIRNENLYSEDGFKDVFDYAEKMFDWKKNFVYKLSTAAEKYIEASAEGKGYVSIITHDNADYTVSQLIELNSLEPETAVELDKKALISPEMSTKQIREVVKSYKNGTLDTDGETDEDSEDGGEQVNNEDATKYVKAILKNIEKLQGLEIPQEVSDYLETVKEKMIVLL